MAKRRGSQANTSRYRRGTEQYRKEQTERYRKLYVKAKAKGLVKDRGAAKQLNPSKYLKSRLNSLEPFLGPEYGTIKVTRGVKKAFSEAPSEVVPRVVNSRAIVRRTPGQKLSTKGGVLRIRERLKAGTFERVPLPSGPRNLNEFRQWIEDNPYYNAVLKHPDEVFNFRIWSREDQDYPSYSYNSFSTIDTLIAELEKYKNFDDGDWGESPEFFSQFELFRSFRDWKFPHRTQEAKRQRHIDRTRRNRERRLARMTEQEREEFFERERERRRAARAASASYERQLQALKQKRKNETPEERERRLAKQRASMKRSRAKRKPNA